MTLAAAILLLGSSSLLNSGLIAQSDRSSTPQSGSAVTQQQPSENPSLATSKSGSGQTALPSAPAKPKKKAGPKRTVRKKQPASANCDPAPTNSSESGAASPTGTGAQTQTTGISEAPKNCPPAKIVVRQGGITEQSIQLAGGSATEATQKREAANQMLAATEDNLKKISGRQLSTDQQDSATQIRQFMNQSKKAMASGDLERAQTLAWKAKLLSDDLLEPGK